MTERSMTHVNLQFDEPAQHISEILRRLDTVYTPPEWEPSGKPVDELVSTILSQNTSDTNTERAFSSLKSRFPAWKCVIDADTASVESTIRSGGLARQKAPRIQQVLAGIIDRDDMDPNSSLLNQLNDKSSAEAMEWLTGFGGVGPKTAACVLLFAVGKPVVPVDTHVYRVSKRIGLIDDRTNANRAHGELVDIVEPRDAFRFHMHLIQHGRQTCRARAPRCQECILNDICRYGISILSNA
ncbi:MAG: endonuclease III [Thermomicrobiaceae bacterium]